MRTITKTIAFFCLALSATIALGQVQNRAKAMPRNGGSLMDFRNHSVMAYSYDTVISPPINNVDSLQMIAIPLNAVSIPNSARHGWNFGINVTVHGSKADTVGLFYWSQASICNNNSAVTNAYTTVGEYISPEVPNANSFVTGLAWYNDLKNHGNNTALTWPTTAGIAPGKCINSGGKKFYDSLDSPNCFDTGYFYVQDLGVMVSVTYNNNLHAFINYINADQVISFQQLFYWIPGLYMNSNYVLADTGLPNPYFHPYLPTSATVTFDTLWDYYTQNFISPITPGSVKVDTIWAALEYRNTSNTPDTVIFQIRSVDSLGYPHRPNGKGHGAFVVYGSDTMILKPGHPLATPLIPNNEFTVKQNYPNPFNNTTRITYTLIKSSDVTFSVSDITGRVLMNNVYTNSEPGEHNIDLSANSLSPGVYFYTIDAGGFRITRNMVITNN